LLLLLFLLAVVVVCKIAENGGDLWKICRAQRLLYRNDKPRRVSAKNHSVHGESQGARFFRSAHKHARSNGYVSRSNGLLRIWHIAIQDKSPSRDTIRPAVEGGQSTHSKHYIEITRPPFTRNDGVLRAIHALRLSRITIVQGAIMQAKAFIKLCARDVSQ
jgi:hypothetical protein